MRVLVVAIVGGLLGLAIGVGVAAAPLWPTQASAEANDFMFLWRYMMVITGVLFGIVTAALVAAIFLFRGARGDDRDGPPQHGITWLEVTWTLVPTLIVVTIVFFSWETLNNNAPSESVASSDASGSVPESEGKKTLQVRVAGYRYAWAYDIPALELADMDQLVLPVDQPVNLNLQGRLKGEKEPIGDVIHSFWVPAWRVQMSTVPGRDTSIGVVPTQLGEFPVVCAFICGPGHAAMNTELAPQVVPPIRVVSRADWKTWIAEQRAAAAKAERDAEAEQAEGATDTTETGTGSGDSGDGQDDGAETAEATTAEAA